MSRNAARYFMGASLLALSSAPVLAQETAQAEEEGNVILVTANKREQNLQKTPIAITAVTSEDVELLGITETTDLGAIAPNVSVNGGVTNATAAVVTIRGIPTSADEALGFDSPIGIYLDGVYLARSAAASFAIADIERIEVLRGPQGTLFGRNTTGGAINYITKAPSDEASLKVRLGYGNYGALDGRAILNTGDLGGLRMTAGLMYRERDGVVDNLLEPRDSRDPGSNETFGVRWAVEADITDNLVVTNVFDYTKIDAVPHAAQLSGVGDGVFRPNVTVDGNTFAQVQPANVGAYLAGATALEAECGAPLASVSLERLDSICLQDAGLSTDKIYGNMTRFELELDNITIRSTTAFRWWDNEIENGDLDGLGNIQGALFDTNTLFNGFAGTAAEPLLPFVFPMGTPQGVIDFVANSPVPTTNQPLFAISNDREQEQFSQEIEIIGGTGTSFEWVLGGFYFEETGSEFNPQRFAFVLDTNQAVFSNFGPLSPAFQAANPAQFRAVAQSSTLGYSIDSESYALYGQGTLRPGGPDAPLAITLGLRYSWDEKSVVRTQNGAAPFATAEEIALNTQSASFSEPTGHITVDYEVSPDLNVYAKASRGYRSGGFNLRQSTQVDDPATAGVNEAVGLIPFGEEKIDAFEIGAKSQFGPVRLNGAVFYNVYSDLQSTVPIPIEGGGSFGTQVVNAGEIAYFGFELEGTIELSDTIRFDGAFGYVNKDVNDFPAADINGVVQNIASIVTPGNSPDYTANAGLTYSDYIGSGDTRLTARFGWNYTSSTPFFPNPLSAPFQQETAAEARHLFNAQLRLDGVSIGSGPEFSVQFWGKNIFDEEYVARGIDYGQLGFGQVIFGDPATYGATVEFTF
jgi:iron complex outermembrane recepter protein